ncbi:Dihydrolipoyllysine-residue succinyltransferase component of 2-oxoglutarate dehydrogenase complex, mitochondrial [Liparis tanakae]|uniref:Dihydrolipoyllysine-residue succinyltransferase component of 2-oxoglutarate dehydrogenase complex, mitochondrial n=1 Tax=Liparis tanakae TaxID=230148 RepID=A0A4Z2IG89_9TELE|nr:Dihydrolipoyllysine-residue succinyltransferase component of 2-oxoglutarate dehydrogenase complex, mitochondrial [Liparis tanakae]
MDGGTFTISNGGVFGSMFGTPIINPPQSAILGMHGIFDRPVAVGGKVEIRPMMYVALTYDHRLIDGREAVLFLRKIKAVVEDPRVLLLDINKENQDLVGAVPTLATRGVAAQLPCRTQGSEVSPPPPPLAAQRLPGDAAEEGVALDVAHASASRAQAIAGVELQQLKRHNGGEE